MIVIKMNDGSTEMVFDRLDLLEAVKKHMGYEVMRLLQDYMDKQDETIADLMSENEALKAELEELKEDV